MRRMADSSGSGLITTPSSDANPTKRTRHLFRAGGFAPTGVRAALRFSFRFAKVSDERDHHEKKACLVAAVGVLLTLTAHAGCNFGPDECSRGFVWREAVAGDHVCVSGTVRQEAARDNVSQQGRVAPPPPGGGRPSFACSNGYVPRRITSGDNVCVTPETRSQVLADNEAASGRVAHQCGALGSLCQTGSLDRTSTVFDCPESMVCQSNSCTASKVSGCSQLKGYCRPNPNFHAARPVR